MDQKHFRLVFISYFFVKTPLKMLRMRKTKNPVRILRWTKILAVYKCVWQVMLYFLLHAKFFDSMCKDLNTVGLIGFDFLEEIK